VRSQLRIGSGLSWIVGWALAVGGPLVYLLWPADLMFWAAIATAFPLMLLIEHRADRTGSATDYYGGGDGGAWGPP
jgi:hypothetical protein